MKTIKKLLVSSTTGIAAAALIAAPALACTPKGKITKYVTDVTTGSQMVDANTVAEALVVHPGDTLMYTIVVANDGGTTKDDADAMIETKLADTFPVGVTATNMTVNEDLGRISEHKSVTKTYTVKVDANAKDGDVITNKACFTGEAVNHDTKQHQKGCDVAIIKVSVPTPPTPPTPPTTPEPPKQPPVEPPKTLLMTGPSNFLPLAGVSAGVGYVANLLRVKRRDSRNR